MSDRKLIADILAEAEAAIEAMGGSRAFVDAVHQRKKDPSLTPLKEALALRQFAQLYNQSNTPKLTYARGNPAGSGGADFTVWDEAESWNRDLELTSVWEREDDFPHCATEDPDVTEVWISMPRLPLDQLRNEVTKEIKRVLKQHARRWKYPTYWLAIYANLSLEAYQLSPDYVAKIVAKALMTKPPSGNVEKVWVWNPRLHLAFPT
jgi:hypothetical protein